MLLSQPQVRRSVMRDGTKVARAFLRSEVYREVRGDAEARPGGKAPAMQPRPLVAPARRARRPGRSTALQMLSLLGLLDVLRGGG
jgi:hypothetical protein